MAARDLFADITTKIIAAIEAGASEYQMPWHRRGAAPHAPINSLTGRPYRGINTLLLWAAAEAKNYSSGRWATYQQWRKAGAQVRKGEQSTAILFWKPIRLTTADSADDESSEVDDRARLVARVYFVFNAAQVDGDAPPVPLLPESERMAATEVFFAGIGADIRHGGDQACYVPSIDQIRMPNFEQFRSAAAYYSVLAHELTHWTGARHRLDRNLGVRFGSDSYAVEELIAELGAAFLMGHLGLATEPRPDHAAYIASWLKVLRSDPRAVITAASNAQAAADYLTAFREARDRAA